MFIRSKDGKHITELHDAQLQGKDLYINGNLFESYDSEEEASEAIRQISGEMNALETFLDLSGEFKDDFGDDDDDFWGDDDDDFWDDDDDDDDDDDEEDSVFDFPTGRILFTDEKGNPLD